MFWLPFHLNILANHLCIPMPSKRKILHDKDSRGFPSVR